MRPTLTGTASLASLTDVDTTGMTTGFLPYWDATSAKFKLARTTFLNARHFGAKGDNVTDDTAAILAMRAVPKPAGASQWAYYFPAGAYKVSTTMDLANEEVWIGDGWNSSWIVLVPGANVTMLQTTSEKKFHAYDIGFKTVRPDLHTPTFPLLHLGMTHSTWVNVGIFQAPADGLELGWSDGSGPGSNDRFLGCHFLTCGNNAVTAWGDSHAFVGCTFENNVNMGMEFHSTPVVNAGLGGSMLIAQCRFENQGAYGFGADRTMALVAKGNYIYDSHVYLGEQTIGCEITGNHLLASRIYDAGIDNIVGPNTGLSSPRMMIPVRYLRPSSRATDPDQSARLGSTYWTFTGAAASKGLVNTTGAPRRSDPQVGKPTAPTRFANLNGTAQQDIIVTAGDTYLIDIYWWCEINGSFSIKLQDAAGPTDLHNSGTLVRPENVNSTDARDYHYRTVFKIPTGVSTLRVLVTNLASGPAVYISQVDVVKQDLDNGGFEGTYVAGLAPGWTFLSGTGTPSAEGTILNTGTTGSQAQRLLVTGANSYAIYQSPVVDSDRSWLLDGRYRVMSGNPQRIQVIWGESISTATTQQFSMMGRNKSSVFHPIGGVFRPTNRGTKLILGVSAGASSTLSVQLLAATTSQLVVVDGTGFPLMGGKVKVDSEVIGFNDRSGNTVSYLTRGMDGTTVVDHAAGAVVSDIDVDVIFDDFALIPLRNSPPSEKTTVSQELVLSGAAQTFALLAPQIDSRLRRLVIQYSEATDVNAGVAINVGVPGTAGYYATMTSQTSQAQWNQTEMTLLKTDIRDGRPLLVNTPGGKTGTGRVQIIAEWE